MPAKYPILPARLPAATRADGVALVLEAPRRATPMILGRLAPQFLAGEQRLYVADAANSFDPYAFSHEARRRGLPDDVLDRVFVSRTFTIHQLAAVTREMMLPLLREQPSPTMAVLGLEHLFLEESLRAAERSRVLRDTMADLEGMRRGGARLLVTHESPPKGQEWWKPMLAFGDVRARVSPQDEEEWKLEIERCDNGANAAYLQLLAPARDRLVE